MTPLQRSTPLYGPSLWFCQSSSTAASSQTDFFNRNKQLNRPVSPHLSILLKNPQMTSMLSITHRITGVMMSFGMYNKYTLSYLTSQTQIMGVI
jgi:succinate dehydrogenase (ubiquinone) cytochrome b560 subunit